MSMAFLVMYAGKILRLLYLFLSISMRRIMPINLLAGTLWRSETSAHSRQPNRPLLHNLDLDLAPLLFS